MNHFEGLLEENEIKARYKDLAKKYHPDLGGDTEIMKEINLQYEQVLEGNYQRQGKSITEIEELLKNNKELMEKLNEILGVNELIVELCGSWIWVTGETQNNKELLKKAKFFWAKKKKAWYWRSDENRSYNRNNYSLAQIRIIHGSETLKNTMKVLIA